MLPSEEWGPRLGPLEEIGVVAAFAQLHDNVQKPRAVSSPIHSLDIFLEQGCIVLLLHLAHPNLEDGLLLGRQRLLHIAFQTAQQEGPEHLQEAFKLRRMNLESKRPLMMKHFQQKRGRHLSSVCLTVACS